MVKSFVHRILALRIGEQAVRLLEKPRFSGSVLAVVTNTIYLSTHDDQILWIAQEGLPAHTRGILATYNSDMLIKGMEVHAQDRLLQIGDSITIDWHHAVEWHPTKIESGNGVSLDVVDKRVRELYKAIRSKFTADDPVLEIQAHTTLQEIERACDDQDIGRIAKQGRKLIGLGGGLTPSGDDFLGGLFFVVYHLQATYPGEFQWDTRPIATLMDWSSTQTNRISHTILSDLVLGQGPEPLHDMITLMLKGATVDEMMPSVERVLALGHMTGRDILQGVLTAMHLITRSMV